MRKSFKWLFGVIGMMFILLLVIFIPSQSTLVFYEKGTDQIAAYLPLKKTQHFQIIFTHSIHLTDVVEKYEVMKNGDILQDEIVYEEFGIGMPSNAEEGQEFESKDGKYHIKNVGNIFQEMKIRNGKTVSKHRLLWGDTKEMQHKVLFNDYFEPGDWFTVKYKKLPLYKTWKEVKIND